MIIRKKLTQKNSTNEILNIIGGDVTSTKTKKKHLISTKTPHTFGNTYIKNQKGSGFMSDSFFKSFRNHDLYEKTYGKMSRWVITKLYFGYKLGITSEAEYKTYKAHFKARYLFSKMNTFYTKLIESSIKLFSGEKSYISKIRGIIDKILSMQREINNNIILDTGNTTSANIKKRDKQLAKQDEQRIKLLKYTAFHKTSQLSSSILKQGSNKTVIWNLSKYRGIEAQFNQYYFKFYKQFKEYLNYFPNCSGAITRLEILKLDITDKSSVKDVFDKSKCSTQEITKKNSEILNKIMKQNDDMISKKFIDKHTDTYARNNTKFIEDSQDFEKIMQNFNDKLKGINEYFAHAELLGIHRYWSLLPKKTSILRTKKQTDTVDIQELKFISKDPGFKKNFTTVMNTISKDASFILNPEDNQISNIVPNIYLIDDSTSDDAVSKMKNFPVLSINVAGNIKLPREKISRYIPIDGSTLPDKLLPGIVCIQQGTVDMIDKNGEFSRDFLEDKYFPACYSKYQEGKYMVVFVKKDLIVTELVNLDTYEAVNQTPYFTLSDLPKELPKFANEKAFNIVNIVFAKKKLTTGDGDSLMMGGAKKAKKAKKTKKTAQKAAKKAKNTAQLATDVVSDDAPQLAEEIALENEHNEATEQAKNAAETLDEETEKIQDLQTQSIADLDLKAETAKRATNYEKFKTVFKTFGSKFKKITNPINPFSDDYYPAKIIKLAKEIEELYTELKVDVETTFGYNFTQLPATLQGKFDTVTTLKDKAKMTTISKTDKDANVTKLVDKTYKDALDIQIAVKEDIAPFEKYYKKILSKRDEIDKKVIEADKYLTEIGRNDNIRYATGLQAVNEAKSNQTDAHKLVEKIKDFKEIKLKQKEIDDTVNEIKNIKDSLASNIGLDISIRYTYNVTNIVNLELVGNGEYDLFHIREINAFTCKYEQTVKGLRACQIHKIIKAIDKYTNGYANTSLICGDFGGIKANFYTRDMEKQANTFISSNAKYKNLKYTDDEIKEFYINGFSVLDTAVILGSEPPFAFININNGTNSNNLLTDYIAFRTIMPNITLPDDTTRATSEPPLEKSAFIKKTSTDTSDTTAITQDILTNKYMTNGAHVPIIFLFNMKIESVKPLFFKNTIKQYFARELIKYDKGKRTSATLYTADEMRNIIGVMDKLMSLFPNGKMGYLKRELGCLSDDDNNQYGHRIFVTKKKWYKLATRTQHAKSNSPLNIFQHQWTDAEKNEHIKNITDFYTLAFPAFIETYLNQLTQTYNNSNTDKERIYYSENQLSMVPSDIKFTETLQILDKVPLSQRDVAIRLLLIPSDDLKYLANIDYKKGEQVPNAPANPANPDNPSNYEALSKKFILNFYRDKARPELEVYFNKLITEFRIKSKGNTNFIQFLQETDEEGNLINIQSFENINYLSKYISASLRLKYLDVQIHRYEQDVEEAEEKLVPKQKIAMNLHAYKDEHTKTFINLKTYIINAPTIGDIIYTGSQYIEFNSKDTKFEVKAKLSRLTHVSYRTSIHDTTSKDVASINVVTLKKLEKLDITPNKQGDITIDDMRYIEAYLYSALNHSAQTITNALANKQISPEYTQFFTNLEPYAKIEALFKKLDKNLEKTSTAENDEKSFINIKNYLLPEYKKVTQYYPKYFESFIKIYYNYYYSAYELVVSKNADGITYTDVRTKINKFISLATHELDTNIKMITGTLTNNIFKLIDAIKNIKEYIKNDTPLHITILPDILQDILIKPNIPSSTNATSIKSLSGGARVNSESNNANANSNAESNNEEHVENSTRGASGKIMAYKICIDSSIEYFLEITEMLKGDNFLTINEDVIVKVKTLGKHVLMCKDKIGNSDATALNMVQLLNIMNLNLYNILIVEKYKRIYEDDTFIINFKYHLEIINKLINVIYSNIGDDYDYLKYKLGDLMIFYVTIVYYFINYYSQIHRAIGDAHATKILNSYKKLLQTLIDFKYMSNYCKNGKNIKTLINNDKSEYKELYKSLQAIKELNVNAQTTIHSKDSIEISRELTEHFENFMNNMYQMEDTSDALTKITTSIFEANNQTNINTTPITHNQYGITSLVNLHYSTNYSINLQDNNTSVQYHNINAITNYINHTDLETTQLNNITLSNIFSIIPKNPTDYRKAARTVPLTNNTTKIYDKIAPFFKDTNETPQMFDLSSNMVAPGNNIWKAYNSERNTYNTALSTIIKGELTNLETSYITSQSDSIIKFYMGVNINLLKYDNELKHYPNHDLIGTIIDKTDVFENISKTINTIWTEINGFSQSCATRATAIVVTGAGALKSVAITNHITEVDTGISALIVKANNNPIYLTAAAVATASVNTSYIIDNAIQILGAYAYNAGTGINIIGDAVNPLLHIVGAPPGAHAPVTLANAVTVAAIASATITINATTNADVKRNSLDSATAALNLAVSAINIGNAALGIAAPVAPSVFNTIIGSPSFNGVPGVLVAVNNAVAQNQLLIARSTVIAVGMIELAKIITPDFAGIPINQITAAAHAAAAAAIAIGNAAGGGGGFFPGAGAAAAVACVAAANAADAAANNAFLATNVLATAAAALAAAGGPAAAAAAANAAAAAAAAALAAAAGPAAAAAGNPIVAAVRTVVPAINPVNNVWLTLVAALSDIFNPEPINLHDQNQLLFLNNTLELAKFTAAHTMVQLALAPYADLDAFFNALKTAETSVKQTAAVAAAVAGTEAAAAPGLAVGTPQVILAKQAAAKNKATDEYNAAAMDIYNKMYTSATKIQNTIKFIRDNITYATEAINAIGANGNENIANALDNTNDLDNDEDNFEIFTKLVAKLNFAAAQATSAAGCIIYNVMNLIQHSIMNGQTIAQTPAVPAVPAAQVAATVAQTPQVLDAIASAKTSMYNITGKSVVAAYIGLLTAEQKNKIFLKTIYLLLLLYLQCDNSPVDIKKIQNIALYFFVYSKITEIKLNNSKKEKRTALVALLNDTPDKFLAELKTLVYNNTFTVYSQKAKQYLSKTNKLLSLSLTNYLSFNIFHRIFISPYPNTKNCIETLNAIQFDGEKPNTQELLTALYNLSISMKKLYGIAAYLQGLYIKYGNTKFMTAQVGSSPDDTFIKQYLTDMDALKYFTQFFEAWQILRNRHILNTDLNITHTPWHNPNRYDTLEHICESFIRIPEYNGNAIYNLLVIFNMVINNLQMYILMNADQYIKDIVGDDIQYNAHIIDAIANPLYFKQHIIMYLSKIIMHTVLSIDENTTYIKFIENLEYCINNYKYNLLTLFYLHKQKKLTRETIDTLYNQKLNFYIFRNPNTPQIVNFRNSSFNISNYLNIIINNTHANSTAFYPYIESPTSYNVAGILNCKFHALKNIWDTFPDSYKSEKPKDTDEYSDNHLYWLQYSFLILKQLNDELLRYQNDTNLIMPELLNNLNNIVKLQTIQPAIHPISEISKLFTNAHKLFTTETTDTQINSSHVDTFNKDIAAIKLSNQPELVAFYTHTIAHVAPAPIPTIFAAMHTFYSPENLKVLKDFIKGQLQNATAVNTNPEQLTALIQAQFQVYYNILEKKLDSIVTYMHTTLYIDANNEDVPLKDVDAVPVEDQAKILAYNINIQHFYKFTIYYMVQLYKLWTNLLILKKVENIDYGKIDEYYKNYYLVPNLNNNNQNGNALNKELYKLVHIMSINVIDKEPTEDVITDELNIHTNFQTISEQQPISLDTHIVAAKTLYKLIKLYKPKTTGNITVNPFQLYADARPITKLPNIDTNLLIYNIDCGFVDDPKPIDIFKKIIDAYVVFNNSYTAATNGNRAAILRGGKPIARTHKKTNSIQSTKSTKTEKNKSTTTLAHIPLQIAQHTLLSSKPKKTKKLLQTKISRISRISSAKLKH